MRLHVWAHCASYQYTNIVDGINYNSHCSPSYMIYMVGMHVWDVQLQVHSNNCIWQFSSKNEMQLNTPSQHATLCGNSSILYSPSWLIMFQNLLSRLNFWSYSPAGINVVLLYCFGLKNWFLIKVYIIYYWSTIQYLFIYCWLEFKDKGWYIVLSDSTLERYNKRCR